MIAWRQGMLAAGACALASCTVADAREDSAPATAPAVAAPDLPDPTAADDTSAPTVTPATAAAEPVRTGFAFAGELTQGGWMRGQAPSNAQSLRLGEQDIAIGENGDFFAAFDRDAASSAELVAVLEDGSAVSQTITVSPRDWNIEHVNVARRPGGASESFMRRRQPELDAIWIARTAESDSDGWKQEFIWPVTGRISGRFGSQRVYRGEPGSYHSGLDIAPGAGTPFVAPADGVVTLAAEDPFSLEGHLIIIDHGAGLNSAFLHSSRIFVTEGQRVQQGDRLGLVGATGRATGPHLHWSIKWHLARLDPLLFVGPMP